jgi:hypothetical protein
MLVSPGIQNSGAKRVRAHVEIELLDPKGKSCGMKPLFVDVLNDCGASLPNCPILNPHNDSLSSELILPMNESRILRLSF